MDKKELQEKIALYYSKLPPRAQEVFASMKWLETLRTISQKYGLNETQIQALGTETTLVLLGITHLVQYEESLTSELELSRDSSDKILSEIEDSIIKTIRPQLVMAFEANKRSETEQTVEPVQKLDKRMEDLPQGTKNVLQESKYQIALYAIAKSYNLTVTQMDFLEKAVGDLIVGAIHPEEFEGFLKKNLSIPPEKIRSLVNEINEKIFLIIRELLKQTNAPVATAPTEEKPAPIAPHEDAKFLKSVGIEIISDVPATPSAQRMQVGKLELEAPHLEKPVEKKGEMLKTIERTEVVLPLNVPTPQKPAEKAKLELPEMPTPTQAHPILAQKLSRPFQVGAVKTEHTLENITKTGSADSGAARNPKVDPYREIPE